MYLADSLTGLDVLGRFVKETDVLDRFIGSGWTWWIHLKDWMYLVDSLKGLDVLGRIVKGTEGTL